MGSENFFKTSLSFIQGGVTFVLYDITNSTLGRKCGMFRAGNSTNAEEKEESSEGEEELRRKYQRCSDEPCEQNSHLPLAVISVIIVPSALIKYFDKFIASLDLNFTSTLVTLCCCCNFVCYSGGNLKIVNYFSFPRLLERLALKMIQMLQMLLSFPLHNGSFCTNVLHNRSFFPTTSFCARTRLCGTKVRRSSLLQGVSLLGRDRVRQ